MFQDGFLLVFYTNLVRISLFFDDRLFFFNQNLLQAQNKKSELFINPALTEAEKILNSSCEHVFMARKSGFVKKIMSESWSDKRCKEVLFCEVNVFF